MSTDQNPRLAKWELETIDALASEDLDRASAREYVQHPERWLERFTADTQRRCLENAKERKRLVRQAERLGIGNARPPLVAELHVEPHDTSDGITNARWTRLDAVRQQLPFDHDWRLLHEDVVTRHVIQARLSGTLWGPADEGMGILDLLEQEAIRMQLFADEPVVAIKGPAALRAFAYGIRGVA
jgi:hypothetical protein